MTGDPFISLISYPKDILPPASARNEGPAKGFGRKWFACVAGPNGTENIYGIPNDASHVVKFNVTTRKLTKIGSDLGRRAGKWRCGVLAGDGCIYCPPFNAEFILQIDTSNDEVKELSEVTVVTESQNDNRDRRLWASAAIASDGCVYAMPFNALWILKFCPAHKRTKKVGRFDASSNKFRGTVVGADGWVYGIPDGSHEIIKINPTESNLENVAVTTVKSQYTSFKCGYGVLLSKEDGHIYAAAYDSGRILKINSNPNKDGDSSWVSSNPIDLPSGGSYGWLYPIIGADSCIYWAPYDANRVLKFNTSTKESFIVGTHFHDKRRKWSGGALNADGSIYCIPDKEHQILRIDTRPVDVSCSLKGTTGGLNDNPKKTTDRLGYQIYAEALTETAIPIEKIDVSLCVGLYGSWGSGKSFLWELIKARYEAKSNEKKKKIIRGKMDEDVNIFERSWALAWAAWYSTVATIFVQIDKIFFSLLCCGSTSALKQEEHLAFMAIVFFPISLLVCILVTLLICISADEGLSLQSTLMLTSTQVLLVPGFLVWIVAFLFCVTTLGIKYFVVLYCAALAKKWLPGKFYNALAEWLPGKCCKEQPADKQFQFALNDCRTYDPFHSRLKKKDNDPEISSKVCFFYLFILVPARFLLLWIPRCMIPGSVSRFTYGSRPEWGELGDEESQQQKLKLSQVRDVLKRRTNLTSTHIRSGYEFVCSWDIVKLAMLELSQRTYNGIRTVILCTFPMRWTFGVDKCDVTKYIPVEFNAWVYSGTDLLWASMMEQLWVNVERECGRYRVRLHRARISISNEVDSDDINMKREKRRNAVTKFFLKILLYALLAGIISSVVVIILVPREDFATILRSVAPLSSFCTSLIFSIPWIMVIVKEVWRSRGEWIITEVKRFEKLDRSSFTEETGFLGKVKKEVTYLYDFLQTEVIADEQLNIRVLPRILLFVDDLDRCATPETIMKVLQAVSLLMENAPITCYLSIDTRRIVTSIEDYFGDRFTCAGLNGYEYLEKIIQLPFCLPVLDKGQKNTFVTKELQNNALNPLNVYKRLNYLRRYGNIKHAFDPPQVDPINDEEILRNVLVPTYEAMMKNDIFQKAIDAGEMNPPLAGEMSPDKAFEAITRKQKFDDSSRKIDQVRDTFMYYISAGIEFLNSNRSATSTSGRGSIRRVRESDRFNGNNLDKSINVPRMAESEGSNDIEAPEDLTYVEQLDVRDAGERYQSSYFLSLANCEEQKWFSEYSEYFIGRPRKMKRIINCYMVSRYLANALRAKESIEMVSSFNKKLLKMIILLEQWPYRMAWLLLVVKNLQQEHQMQESNLHYHRVEHAGDKFTSLFQKNFEENMEEYGELNLIDIYDRFVQVLIHSSPDSTMQLKRDGDAQVFEQILLHGDASSIMKLKDLSLPGKDGLHSLRPFVFNLQTHMTEKVAVELENYLLVSSEEDYALGGQTQLSPASSEDNTLGGQTQLSSASSEDNTLGDQTQLSPAGSEDNNVKFICTTERNGQRKPYRHAKFHLKSSFFDRSKSTCEINTCKYSKAGR